MSLKITYKDESFDWPLATNSGRLSLTLRVYEDWRPETDEPDSGPVVNINVGGEFSVPQEDFSTLYKSDLFFVERLMDAYERGQDLPQSYQILFDLDINYKASHAEDVCRTILSGNIDSFQPDPRDLVGLILSPEIVKESRIWLGNEMNFEPQITAISFGALKDNHMELTVDVEVEAPDNTARLTLDLNVPIAFYARAGMYSDCFPGASIKERFSEVRACFAHYYNIDDYDLIEAVVNEERKQVTTQFILKPLSRETSA